MALLSIQETPASFSHMLNGKILIFPREKFHGNISHCPQIKWPKYNASPQFGVVEHGFGKEVCHSTQCPK